MTERKWNKSKWLVNLAVAAMLLFATVLAGCASGGTNTNESSSSNSASSSSGGTGTANAPDANSNQETENANEAPKTNYPERPVQVIVPTGSGGDTDINARIISKYLEQELGQPLVVTNVTGAGGVIGSRQVKDANPDGYTVLFFHYGTLTQTLMGTADFYLLDDFDVVGIPILDNTSVIVAKKGKYTNMQDLISDAKANPGQVKFAIEVGTVAHLIGYILQDYADVEFKLVDTGAAATKYAALLSGQSDAFFAQYLGVRDYVESGEFQLLGLIADERNPGLPDVPTLIEQGIDLSLP
jgi:Uncharacterized protein conserved in bacteria